MNILNNRPKFEAIVSECDNILNSINQSPFAPSKPAPGFGGGGSSVNTWTNESPLKRLCYKGLLRSWNWINLNNSKNYAK
nr:MAG TPA: hypothetical protein [Caudoviricetes sp.]